MKIIKTDKKENPVYLAEHSNWQLRILIFPFFALPLGAVISDLPRVSLLTIVGLFISICFGTIFLLRWGVIFKPEEKLITTFWGPYFLKFKSNLNSDNIKYFRITRKLNSLSNEEALMLYDFIAVTDDGNEKDIVKGVERKDYEKLLNTLKYYSKEIVNDWKVDATPKTQKYMMLR